jgi:6-phosphogluconolactonase
MNPSIKIFPSTEAIAGEIADMLFELAVTADNGPIHIALSGGNTPKTIFNFLNEKYGSKLSNSRFHFWWGDERCVPPTHDESNFKWAYHCWLQPIGVAESAIHRIKGENNPEDEANRYADEMKNFVGIESGFPCFDLIMLGLGDDGHTASIFPSNSELLTSGRWCEVASHPLSGQKRITFTGKVLNNAKHIVFISTGESKATMVRNVAIDSDPKFPASHIQPQYGMVTWLIDEDASRML